MSSPLRGATAVVGVGTSSVYRRGGSPEGELTLTVRAVMAACADAGIHPRDIDGFTSYGGDRNAGQRLMGSLGTRDLRWSSSVWDGGGGGLAGAIGNAAAAIVAGQAEVVAVVRGVAERSGGRLRDDVSRGHFDLQYQVNGVQAPAQICALRTQRLLHEGVPESALYAVAAASYHHASRNPRAFGRDTDLDHETYLASRWVSEPLRLFDCSRENDGAAAIIVVSAQQAAELTHRPAYVLASQQGADAGFGELGESVEPYWSAGFASVARRLWNESGYGPNDVDVAEVYTNFTGPAVAALIDHGFCTLETAGNFCTTENLTAPHGRLPINTSGGDLAEGFLHGALSMVEAVRQIRGDSYNQVPGASLALLTGGPAGPLVSSVLFGSESTL